MGEMAFDAVREGEGGLRYGFVTGGKRVALIKAGLGGDIFGDANKYLQIAHLLRGKYGFGAVVASNPEGARNWEASDLAALSAYAREAGIAHPEYFFFGHSNGGAKGLSLASMGVPFRRMILVNMPLMINFHRTKEYIARIPQTSILAVFGERDPSISYVPFLEGRFENLRVLTVSGADHNFKGMADEFVGLSDFLRV